VKTPRLIYPVALFVASCAAALLVLAPASLFSAAVEQATDGRLTIAGATGKIWQGSGRLTGVHSGVGAPVEWKLSGIHVFPAEITATVQVGRSERLALAAGFGGAKLTRVDIELPAPLVADALNGFGAYRIGGTVRLSTGEMLIQRQAITTRLMIHWSDATSGMISVAPLGSFDIACDIAGAGGNVAIKSMSGPLLINGTARWSKANSMGQIEARAAGPQAEVIEGWLRTIGSEKADRVFQITWPLPPVPQTPQAQQLSTVR
jgi:general secretion pathway protein N